MSYNKKSKKIVVNTFFLYLRMLTVLGISLYTSRLILSALGVEDYGIYSVVAGFVTMMSFLTGAMSSSTQRFLSYEEGLGSKKRLNNIFSMSVNIYLIAILIIILFAELVGIWFVNKKLNIPIDRLEAANWAYQCAILSFCFTVITTPYSASIIASEKMKAFAYIGIAEVVIKLVVAIGVSYSHGDRLIAYSLLLAISSCLIWVLYYTYCRLNIDYTTYNFYWDKKLLTRLSEFMGWNLVGNIALVGMNQGLNILLNIFFGPVINATRAISNQCNMAIRGFSSNLQMAMNPMIIKSYASDEKELMLSLVFKGSKYSFFLLLVICLPVLLRTKDILYLWLGVLPDNVVIFCQLALIDSLVISLSGTLLTAVQAVGKIKRYQVVIGGVLLLNLPISAVLLNYGASSEVTMYVMLVLSTIALFFRLYFLRVLLSISVKKYFFDVLLKVILVTSFSSLCLRYINSFFGNSYINIVYIGVISFFVCFISIFVFGLDVVERTFIIKNSKKMIERFRCFFMDMGKE